MSFWDTLKAIGGVANPVGLAANLGIFEGGKKVLGAGKGDKPPGPDQASMQLDKLLDYAKQTQAQNTSMLEGQVKPGIDALGGAGQLADARNTLVGANRYVNTNELSGNIDQYGNALDSELGQFKNNYGDVIKNLGDISWEDAKSAGEGLDAQRNALQKYGALTNPAVTAQERFMAENARRQAETQERASRDAVMSDLGARGMRGSGAELTNMLGSQQLTGQDRVLADMGTNANAIARSMSALKGYGDVAGSMRQSDDVMSMFNAQQGEAAKQWKQGEAAREEETRHKTVEEGLGAKEKADTDKYAAWDKYYGDQDKYASDAYGRQKDYTGALADYGGLWTGANSSGANAVMNGYGQVAGHYAAKDAAHELNKKRGIFNLGIGPF